MSTESPRDDNDNLGLSLTRSIASSDLQEVSADIAEILLDSAMDEGILKDIPVFGWLLKAYNTYHSISDRLFLRKIAMFLHGVGEASIDDREAFLNKLGNDRKYQRRVGENLLLLIDKHERLEKSFLLGKLMARVVETKLSNEDFLRLAAALDRSSVEDLEQLKTHKNDYVNEMDDAVKQGLYRSGLLDLDITAHMFAEPLVNTNVDYRLNELGEKLIEFALDDG